MAGHRDDWRPTNDWGENLSADKTYRWSPAVAGSYTFTLEAEAGSDLNPKLRIVNSSTCEEIHNEDDGELTRQVDLGTWVLVADGQGGSSGAFTLSVSLCKAYQDLGVALGPILMVTARLVQRVVRLIIMEITKVTETALTSGERQLLRITNLIQMVQRLTPGYVCSIANAHSLQ